MNALAADTDEDARYSVSSEDGWALRLSGHWVTQRITSVDGALRSLELPERGPAEMLDLFQPSLFPFGRLRNSTIGA